MGTIGLKQTATTWTTLVQKGITIHIQVKQVRKLISHHITAISLLLQLIKTRTTPPIKSNPVIISIRDIVPNHFIKVLPLTLATTKCNQ